MCKDALRHTIRERIRNLSHDDIRRKSSSLTERLSTSVLWRESRQLFGFLSLPREVQTGELLRRALREGRVVGCPAVDGSALVFRRLQNLDSQLVRGSYGIREPAPHLETLDPRLGGPTLVLVPGLAFTREGWRLGRGKGFYDRFLAEHGDEVSSVGVCFSEQVVEHLPTDTHDAAVDFLVTENEVADCSLRR